MRITVDVRHVCATLLADDGEIELEADDDLNVTADEIAAEEEEEPMMMTHAKYWDNFLDLVNTCNEEWATPEDDTDEYRKGRAVRAFNAGLVCSPPPPCPFPSPSRSSLPSSPLPR